jgi:catechol 2,3-dioxygenase-like lactoylglutathione lyase family enzyme
MTETTGVLDDVSFCDLVVGVTDMDRALAFYRDVIGMEVVFESLISGEPFDAVLHATRKQEGRRIQNGSLSVTDLDDTHRRITAAGYTPEQAPFEIGGVRMFFVKDPDGTPVEFIELPNGAHSTYEIHCGVRLHMGPVK